MNEEPVEYVLPFPDRRAAGRFLGERLEGTVDLHDWAERTVVLGLPRGGVAVAEQVAAVLAVPMNVMVTRKIGYPPQPELGVGAIAETPGDLGTGPPVYDSGLLATLSITPADLAEVVTAEEAELARRVRVYRGGSPLPPVAGWCAIVVDDGLATGATARAALRSLRAAGAGHLVLAVPVAPAASAAAMRAEADQVVVLATPRLFSSVGEWYESFGQLSDADVLALLTPESGLRGVRPAHAPTTLGRTLILVQPAPGAILLRPRHRVVQALQPHRAGSANLLRLALPDLSLRLTLAVGAEEEQQVLATARGSILPPPVRAGEHGRLPTYLRHGSITSTKLHQMCVTVERQVVRTQTSPVRSLRCKIQRVLVT